MPRTPTLVYADPDGSRVVMTDPPAELVDEIKAEHERRSSSPSSSSPASSSSGGSGGADYESWGKPRLKNELLERGLKVSGTSAELVERLQESDRG